MNYSQALKQVRAWAVACARPNRRKWPAGARSKFKEFAGSDLGRWVVFTVEHEPDHVIARIVKAGGQHARHNP